MARLPYRSPASFSCPLIAQDVARELARWFFRAGLLVAAPALASQAPATDQEAGTQNSRRQRVPDGVILRELSRAHIQTWTPVTIRQVGDGDLEFALAALDLDHPQLARGLAGPNSNPETLHHTVLEEIGDRGLFQHYYLYTVAGRDVADRYVQGRQGRRTARFRGVGIVLGGVTNSTSEEREVTTDPISMAMFDIVGGNIFFDNRGDGPTPIPNPEATMFALSLEQSDAVGLPRLSNGLLYGRHMTDVARYSLAYAVGRQDEFNPQNPAAVLIIDIRPRQANGTAMTYGELQVNYCRVLPTIYQVGDQLNPRDSSFAGLVQARVDEIKTGDDTPGIGITGPCR